MRGVGEMAGWVARTSDALGGRPNTDRVRRWYPDDRQRALASGPLRSIEAGQGEPARARMAALLAESAEAGKAEARDRLYGAVVAALVPDEARILSVLAKGAPFPVLDVAERTRFGGVGRVVLRNVSTVGKVAGVTLDDRTPVYLTRLMGLGLAELADGQRSLSTQYEILTADDTVVQVVCALRRPMFVRQVIRISRFGTQLWQECDPTGAGRTQGHS